MAAHDQASNLFARKAVAMIAIVGWLAVLGFASGPVRWEVQHSYSHWIEVSRGHLPTLTATVSLPVLGLVSREPLAQLARLVFWTVLWLPPLLSLEVIRRADSRLKLLEILVLGGAGYAVAVSFVLSLVVLGLWLPFALL